MERGRYWVALWLLFFLGTLAWIVSRQSRSFSLADRDSELEGQRSALEAVRARELRRLREAQSRSRLVPLADSMGLRLPADSEIVILTVPIGR